MGLCRSQHHCPALLHVTPAVDGTQVVFFGDSTARRAATQLMLFLLGSTRFMDHAHHASVSRGVSVHGMNVSVTSHWTPSVNTLKAFLQGVLACVCACSSKKCALQGACMFPLMFVDSCRR